MFFSQLMHIATNHWILLLHIARDVLCTGSNVNKPNWRVDESFDCISIDSSYIQLSYNYLMLSCLFEYIFDIACIFLAGNWLIWSQSNFWCRMEPCSNPTQPTIEALPTSSNHINNICFVQLLQFFIIYVQVSH